MRLVQVSFVGGGRLLAMARLLPPSFGVVAQVVDIILLYSEQCLAPALTKDW